MYVYTLCTVQTVQYVSNSKIIVLQKKRIFRKNKEKEKELDKNINNKHIMEPTGQCSSTLVYVTLYANQMNESINQSTEHRLIGVSLCKTVFDLMMIVLPGRLKIRTLLLREGARRRQYIDSGCSRIVSGPINS